MHPSQFTAVQGLLALVLLTACSGGNDGVGVAPQPLPPTVATVTVTAANSTPLVPGATVQMFAQALTAAGADVPGAAISWSSAAAGTATVSATGLVTAVAPGTATITATVGGKSGSATVTVTPPATLIVPGDSAVPGTPLVVTVRGPRVIGQVTGTLGSATVLFGRQTDSTMVTMTPEVPTGTAVLRVSIGGGTGQVTVNVRAVPAIAAPAATVTTAINETLARVPVAPPTGTTAVAWQTHLVGLQQLAADAKGWIQTAAPSEQLTSARLMEQVRVALAAMPPRPESPAMQASAPAAPRAAATVTAACVVQAGFFLTALTAYLAAISLVVLALLAPGVNILLTVPGLLLVANSLPQLTPAATSLIAACGTQKIVMLAAQPFINLRASATTGASAATTAATFTFERGKSLRVFPGETVQPFDGTQVNASPEIAKASAAVEMLYATVASLPDWARKSLTLMPPRLSTIPAQASVTRAAPTSAVRIENVTGGVTLRVTPDGGALLLEASSTSTVDVPFAFDVVSTTDPTVRQTMSALLNIPVSVAMSPSVASVNIGQTAQLAATVTGTTNTQVTYTVVSGTATVSSTGVVRPLLPGLVVVRATSVADPTKSATATVTATIPFGQTYSATFPDIGRVFFDDNNCMWTVFDVNIRLRVTYAPPQISGSNYSVTEYYTFTRNWSGSPLSSCGSRVENLNIVFQAYAVGPDGAYVTNVPAGFSNNGRFLLDSSGNLTLVGSGAFGSWVAR